MLRKTKHIIGALYFISCEAVFAVDYAADHGLTLPQDMKDAITAAQQGYIDNHFPSSPAAPLMHTCSSGESFCTSQDNAWKGYQQSPDRYNPEIDPGTRLLTIPSDPPPADPPSE